MNASTDNMQAVILAAGLGTRLLPVTANTPKALVVVRGQPIIAHVLDSIPIEITSVIIVVGYKGDQISSLLGSTYKGKKIIYVTQEKPLGTLNALEKAAPYLTGRFLVLNADDLIHREDAERLLKYDLSVLVTTFKMTHPFGVCELDDNAHVKKFTEKPIYTSLINTGTYVLDKRIFDIKIDANEKGEVVLATAIGKLASVASIKAVRTKFYKTLTSPDDLKKLNEEIT